MRCFRGAYPILAILTLALAPSLLVAQRTPARGRGGERSDSTGIQASTLSGLRFRNLGPATTSGRIADIAVHPSQPRTWYVAAASGGIWKTVNAGTTWSPVFDRQGSYAIGALAIAPSDPLTVWAGTGENNSQRSVGYGDGVYKSTDGGRTWKNMGLRESGHIGRVAVHPTDPSIVYVAAQGPLWSGGGDRGVYRTTDGGITWEKILAGENDWTGANEIHMDPRNPDVLYAVMWQRFRRQWGFINGGPGSGLHKSTDGGATWTKLSSGLPSGDLGKIGLAVSPADPNTVYAIVEAADRGGFYRSTDAGGSWRRMSAYNAGPPFYYHEITPDPVEVERIYSVDVGLMVSADSGHTFSGLPTRTKHVDHHALWIDPHDHTHLITGNDGGLYESFDRGATWRFHANLPLTQFYKVALDNAEPFYGIYGGTQDNNTLGGPARTLEARGIRNENWFVVTGGDGFQPRVDPSDPNIVYGESQYGVLVRLDRRTGERINIQPQEDVGDAPLRWNWDSPLIISPHDPARLYFAAQRLFRSDDRGDTWRPISGDLTRNLDRNALKMMDRIWSVDAVAKNTSTSFYGNIVTVEESPLVEGLLYAGTDDGLIQVSEDGGGTWRMIDHFPGVPDTTYVSDIVASLHDSSTVYATFNNQKAGDYRPYVLKSIDRGRTWTAITHNLPDRGGAWTIAEDHAQPSLLWVGTEFGLFVSLTGGDHWIQMRSGLPVIPVRDIAVQRRANDLVLATFGRGFYVLDDYTPLRQLTPETLAAAASLLPVPSAELYIAASTIPGGQGDAVFTADNPAIGATFTYHVRQPLRTARDRRRQRERAAAGRGEDTPYPSIEALRAEAQEEDPTMVLTVETLEGQVVDRMTGPASAGLHRVTWNLRHASLLPVTGRRGGGRGGFGGGGFGGATGPLAVPGSYRVTLAQRVNGVETQIGEPQTFEVQPIGQSSLPATDRTALLAFESETARLQRAVMGTVQSVAEVRTRIDALRQALDDSPTAAPALRARIRELDRRLDSLSVDLTGDRVVQGMSEPVGPSISGRVQGIVRGHWNSTSAPTQTHRREYAIASADFTRFLAAYRTLVETDLAELESAAEAAGVPWTPGRIPEWRP